VKDPVFFLNSILEAINLIEQYISGKSRELFLESVQIQDSILRRLEIIGEAVKICLEI
jgi:uncharacterized protein with HEPN domain